MYEHFPPTINTSPQNQTAGGLELMRRKVGYPITILLGGTVGCVLVAGAIYFAWLSARSSTIMEPEVLRLLASTPPKKVEEPSPLPSSSVIGVAKRADPKADLPAISLQEAAMKEVAQLREPAGTIHATKPMKEITFKPEPLNADDPMLAEAQKVIKYFYEAKSMREKSALVKGGRQILEKMTHYYSNPSNRDPVLDEPIGAQVVRVEKTEILQLDFTSSSRHDGKASALFFRTKGGALLLDWESFVGFSDLNWQEYAEKRPQTPLWMRAVAEADDYYNYEFADDKHFLSVRLSSPDGSQRMHGFVPRGTPLGYMLRERLNYEEFNLTGRRMAAVMVSVRTTFPYNAKSGDCVNIRELIANRWLLFDWEMNSNP